MTEIATFICFMVWLFAGGCSFSYFLERIDDKSSAGMMLLICALFGPFMAGAAWMDSRQERRQALSGSEKE